MCGIVGYVGPRSVVDILIPGLAHLEYRGYDSAGIAVQQDQGISVVKKVGRIAELETKVGGAEVIDPPTSGDRITFASTVLLEDETGKEIRYQIVGSDEADPAKGRISIMSPLARTLIGKNVGARVTAQLPAGTKTFDIVKVNFPWTD